MPFLSGYNKRKAITISATYADANLSDFPLLVTFAGDTDIGTAAATNGQNLRFTLSDGTTLLKYERGSFSISAGAATGRFRVKSPVTTGSNASIYCYYDNSGAADGADPTNVWDSNYKAVWHLDETSFTAGATVLDATGNGYNLTITGSNNTSVAGVDGGALQNTAAGNYAGSTANPLYGATDITIEAIWSLSAVIFDSSRFITFDDGGAGNSYYFDPNAGFRPVAGFGAAAVAPDSTPADNTTYQWAGRVQSNAVRLFVNGVQQTGTNTLSGSCTGASTGTLKIGRNDNGRTLKTDEVRLSNVARSAAWLKFQYHNTFDAGNQISFGSEETGGSGTSAIAGSSSGTGSGSGVIRGRGVSVGGGAGTGAAAGGVRGRGVLGGALAGDGAMVASLLGRAVAVGAAAGVASAAPAITGVASCGGSAAGTATAGAPVKGRAVAAGAVAGSATAAGGIFGRGVAAAVVAGVAAVSGAVLGRGTVAAAAAGLANVAGRVRDALARAGGLLLRRRRSINRR